MNSEHKNLKIYYNNTSCKNVQRTKYSTFKKINVPWGRDMIAFMCLKLEPKKTTGIQLKNNGISLFFVSMTAKCVTVSHFYAAFRKLVHDVC